ncbi:MAG: ABC transporter substrate-binding protein [Proteobacteria bacterium]|nr:ABC transporter substrate-binding protein [Pseudomonadota bacterium]
MKKIFLLFAALAVLTALSPVSFAAEPYVVGAVFAITGPASWLGEPERNTVTMVAEEINAQGGINGHPLQIIVEDTVGEETRTVLAVNKLINKDNVLAIVGPTRSGTTMAVIPIVEKAQVSLISCASAEEIVRPVRKWVFKTAQNDSHGVLKIYDKLKEMNITRVAVISSTDGYGMEGRKQLKRFAQEYGITIVADETYGPKDTDMTAQLTKIKGTDAQALVNWSIVPGQTTVIKNRRQLGMSIPLFQSPGFGNIKYARAAGDAADGLMFPALRLLMVEALPADHPQKALLATYKKDYESRFKSDVSTFGGHAYDAIHLVIAALRAVGPDRAKIRDYIENSKNFVGTGGVFNYSADNHVGLNKDALELYTVKGGAFALVK